MTKPDPILEALTQQVDCYRMLAKLAEIQHEHVQHDQTEALLEVLKRRQIVLEQIAMHEHVLAPAKRQWPQYTAGIAEDQRSRADGLMNETKRLLEQITLSDQNDALVLQQRKLNLGKELGQANAARKVNRNYAATAYGGMRTSRMDVQR